MGGMRPLNQCVTVHHLPSVHTWWVGGRSPSWSHVGPPGLGRARVWGSEGPCRGRGRASLSLHVPGSALSGGAAGPRVQSPDPSTKQVSHALVTNADRQQTGARQDDVNCPSFQQSVGVKNRPSPKAPRVPAREQGWVRRGREPAGRLSPKPASAAGVWRLFGLWGNSNV